MAQFKSASKYRKSYHEPGSPLFFICRTMREERAWKCSQGESGRWMKWAQLYSYTLEDGMSGSSPTLSSLLQSVFNYMRKLRHRQGLVTPGQEAANKNTWRIRTHIHLHPKDSQSLGDSYHHPTMPEENKIFTIPKQQEKKSRPSISG